MALPAIQEGLAASVAEMQWIASIYTLFLAALTLAAGSAGDRFGRRRLFAAGLAVLAVASVAAGCAADATQLDGRARGAGHRAARSWFRTAWRS